MLAQKNAVILGGGGSLGGAVASALAASGARVFLAGRTLDKLQQVATAITRQGGEAHTQQLDALDESQVNDYLSSIQSKYGSLDICFNAIDLQPVQGVPLLEMQAEDFVRPVRLAMQSMFISSKAAAKIMRDQGSGIILSLTATSAAVSYPYTGGFAPAGAAIEMLSKNLAGELGVYGIRVVNIRSGGSPDSRVFKEVIEQEPEMMASVLRGMEDDTMLKRMPLMKDIADVAVFLCSDYARQITGVTIDVTAGSTSGLSYRVARPVNWPKTS